MNGMIEVLTPTGGARVAEDKPLPGVSDLQNKVIGLLDNRKPNFTFFLDRLATLLIEEYRVAKIVRMQKSGPSSQEGAMLDKLAQDCDLVITGSGD